MLQKASYLPSALYLTSPDYLGNVADIASIAEVCHRYGMLLLVDCAHGAYLRFLPTSLYPTDLGADMCCSSAHKTLPVLTGGAYLHISKRADASLLDAAKNSLALFGSTSPSYLILQSLDAANAYLANDCRENLSRTVARLDELKKRLALHGYQLVGNEPLKITLATKSYGYTGVDFAEHLRQNGIECEFADHDFVVLMSPTDVGTEELAHLEMVATSLPQKEPITVAPPALTQAEHTLRIAYALLWPSETVAIEDSVGRILASPSVSCPPAVPILMCGERIDKAAVSAFRYYGVEKVRVVIELDKQLDKL
jgi:arginine/lysine/ornithine decarboxylase